MLQLKKSIHLESLNLPLKKAIHVAADLGADAVEINARTQLRPGELSRTGVRHFRKMLADLNLKVATIHFPTRRGYNICLLYTSPSPRDATLSRMPSSA